MAPNNAETAAKHRRAWSLFRANQLSEAGTLYRQICKKDRRDDRARLMLGIIQGQLGNYIDAETWLRQAISLNPKNFDAQINHGLALYSKGSAEQALASYHKALKLHPDHPAALLLAANAYASLDRLTEASRSYERVLQQAPGHAVCLGNLANVLAYQGRMDEAVEKYRQSLELNPDQPAVHSNLLLCLHYSANHDPEDIFREHLAWASRHTRGISASTTHANDRQSDRQLRIGYVTSHLRGHSVAYFLEPILAHHDRTHFEIYTYVDPIARDATTERLWKLAGTVRDTSRLSDSAVAKLVCDDRIDILVDLAGHTEGNRLLAFAYKPAPIQMTYLGYPDTSGLNAIDYRITDLWADPPDATEHLHSEKLVRLRNGFLCFRPPEESPPVTPLPAADAGYVTFASFNALTKITSRMLAVWATILKELPQSRILIKNRQLSDATLRERVCSELQHYGVARERIDMLGKTSKQEHMAAYGRVDIALDAFPYNGTTTTCDTLWMGIPVITLAGRSHVSRTGVSLLTAVGLESLIANNEDEYVSHAISLAGDLPRLKKMRGELRNMMQHSRLCNGAAFTRELESMYRRVWEDWCKKTG